MSKLRRSLPKSLKRFILVVIAGALAAGGGWAYIEWNRPPKPTLAGLMFVSARRADVNSVLITGGRTASENSTLIDAQIERLASSSEGRVGLSSGASTILWVIDDGSYVKKGDLLCSLNSSEYEELVRQQQIRVDRAKADLQKAKLDFETSQMGVAEFRDGLMQQTQQANQGKLTMAESDKIRALAHLAWSERMTSKGYMSQDQLDGDKLTLKRCELAIVKAKWELKNFNDFGAPIELKSLNAALESARADLIYFQVRHERFIERFEYYKKMVGYCTIRAPHDGFVIYANTTAMFTTMGKIEQGASVRQGQSLFYLPDLQKMKLIAPLHESVVTKVRPGMKVHARVPGLSNREIEGRVVKIDPLPDTENSWLTDKRSFNATIHLEAPPRGIRPEMSAEVEIDLSSHADVIAIPPEALAVEEGGDYCYVAAAEGQLERRHVKLGDSNFDLLEVVEGLDEGEQVVSDVSHIEDYAELVVDSDHVEANHHTAAATSLAPSQAHAVAASHSHEQPHKSGL